MPRPKKCRRICAMPEGAGFRPLTGGEGPPLVMEADEYEAVRLMDYEGLTQEQCAGQMEIARTTVTGIYESARRKLARALIEGKSLIVAGGNVAVCPKENCPVRGRGCCHRAQIRGK